ncbi:glycosyl transferase family 2 [Chitinophaga caeni]|uniref:Glycosyl transferase family 2 n=2 Tax=Chitinophaga caeni TaxID=2029983 RepID=A0A291QSR3_9BACT|nr:glycosyl transferase family 2 [Chitinophaga caeni]
MCGMDLFTYQCKAMISIVIPVLNEGNTIRQVIRTLKKTTLPHEIILVDDNSIDNTVSEAMKEKVRVITSSIRGKGISMLEGMMAAKYDTIVYLDGDILTYTPDVAEKLAAPILDGDADFVKSYFQRQAGRVTELVAKPLLSILFPEIAGFHQPLSGMIAARKDFLKEIQFENDYGVDIGLLIDMHMAGARIVEVNIGKIENNMQSWEQLGKMSREVSRTILQKAENFPIQNLETLSNIHLIREQMERSIMESIDKLQKMIIFNLDEVLLTQDYMQLATLTFDKEEAYQQILQHYSDPIDILKRSVHLFENRNIAELQEVADEIPLVTGASDVIRDLKKKGYVVGIVTDGFETIAHHIKNKLGIDFVFANRLHFYHSVATGEITIPEYFLKNDPIKGFPKYDKSYLLEYIEEKYHIPTSNIIYVGSGKKDADLLSLAGIGIAFSPAIPAIEKVADRIIPGNNIYPLLKIVPSMPVKYLPWYKNRKLKRIGFAAIATIAVLGTAYWLHKRQCKKQVIQQV